uniref:RING-type domain-containing protein n=1 Tax=Romanomermis culicivorax TaxID=13658 RepID=A0A915IJH5_ROMCU
MNKLKKPDKGWEFEKLPCPVLYSSFIFNFTKYPLLSDFIRAAGMCDVENDLAKLVECPVCLDFFDRPKMLWCAHALCQKCISRMVASNGNNYHMFCPLCRKYTRIPRQGLPLAYALQELVNVCKRLKSSKSSACRSVSPVLPLKLEWVASTQTTSLTPLPHFTANHLAISLLRPTIDQNSTAQNLAFTNEKACTVKGGSRILGNSDRIIGICHDCSISGPLIDDWICTECDYKIACSKCAMLRHRSHPVLLAGDLRQKRKEIVLKWFDELSDSIDRLYNNRTEINYIQTELRVRRSHSALWKIEDGGLVFGDNLDENGSEFAWADDRFVEELNSLPTALTELLNRQQVLLTKLNIARSKLILKRLASSSMLLKLKDEIDMQSIFSRFIVHYQAKLTVYARRVRTRL